MAKKTLVTSALVYANGHLHIGHLVEYIQTDIFVRFKKLMGEDVIYCCADDTHGAPISINAEKEGMTPEKFIEKFYKEHVEDFKTFLVDFDSYYTTHSPENEHYSNLMFERCKKAGYIYKKNVNQLYCEKCRRFLPDRYVKGTCPKCGAKDQYGDVCEKCGSTYKAIELEEPYCSICGSAPVEKGSEHYFFKLSAFSDKLEQWLDTNKNLQKEIVNSVKQWIKEGLNDWDISRDGPYFGFKIPGEEDLYYYVWFDAPIGYIASTQNYTHNIMKSGTADQYWLKNDSQIIHFIGKDIIYFHFLFWPAVLMASGFRVPDNIVVHGFLTVNGEKMSKSRGTFFTAKEFAAMYEPEYLRYYYANLLGKKMSDVDLNFNDFIDRVNNELVANLGNFCYRALTFLKKNFDGKFSDIDENKALIEEFNSKIDKIKAAYIDINFNEAAREIMAASALGNRYFQEKQPWKLVKEDKEQAEKVLGLCVNIAKNLAILMKPIMPKFASELESQLNLSGLRWDDLGFELRGHEIADAGILIKKIEKDEVKEASAKKADSGNEAKKAEREADSSQQTMPFNLRVGKVTQVEDHPDAEKLYVIQVDLGNEKRQLVAGLKPYIEKDKVLGKKIAVVINLEPAKLRGKDSQGMLLAADKEGVVKLVEPSGNPGDRIFIEGFADGDKIISFKEFLKNKCSVMGKKVIINGKSLATQKGAVVVDIDDGAVVR